MPTSTPPPTPTRPRLEVVLASHRVNRFSPTIGNWLVRRAEEHGAFDVGLLDLAAVELPIPHPRDPAAAAPELLGRFDRADALAIVVPEYNHSFPGILKVAIDLVGDELTDTPVGLVTYGGMSSGLRAAEALRPVLAAVRALAVTDTVGFANPRDRFEDGQLVEGVRATTEATNRLLDELSRFATALHTPADGDAADAA